MNISTKNLMKICAMIALSTLFLATEAYGQATAAPKALPGRITKQDGSAITGNIRWLPQGKKYVVSKQGAGGSAVTTDVAASEVAKVEVAKPANLDAAIRAVQQGKGSSAIATLEAIVSQYAMLQWDEVAGRYLADALLSAGRTAEAVKACEGIIKSNPSAAYLGDVAPIYWKALLQSDKKAKLNELLGKAISSGNRMASASALVMRGDFLMEQKEYFNSLKDGYLRAVVLYADVRAVQPEAMYKAAKAFEAMGNTVDSQKLISELRTKYPQSEYARK